MINYAQWAFFPAKVIVVSLVSLLLVLQARKTSASRRHVLAMACLMAMLVLPWMGLFVPSRSVNVPTAVAIPAGQIAVPGDFVAHVIGVSPRIAPSGPTKVQSALAYIPQAEFYIWLLGFGALIWRLAAGYRRVRRWRRTGIPFEGEGIVLSDEAVVPMAACILKPTILLPKEAVAWDRERLERVLLHERAHIRRKDCLWNLVGQVVCAWYWPLPTVWILQRLARASAEQACDDLVLRAGNRPAEYAQDLLDSARNLKLRWPSPALPLVTNAEVATRIKRVLDTSVKRAPSGVATVGVAAFLALGITVPLSSARIYSTDMPFPATIFAVDQNHYGSPGSEPGLAENGFVGTLPDGRRVELLQIQRNSGHGFEAWKPDGTPIASPHIYGRTYWMKKQNQLELVFRFPSKSTDDSVNAGIGSGPSIPGEPVEQTFAGGGVLKADGSGYRTCVCFQEINASGMTRSSYTFGVSDTLYKNVATVRTTPDGKYDVDSSTLKDVTFQPKDSVKVPIPDAKGGWKLGKDGKYLWRTANGCSLQFLAPGEMGDLEILAYDGQGKAHDHIWNEGGFVKGRPENGLKERYYFEMSGSDVSRIEVGARQYQSVVFEAIKLHANSAPPP